MSPVHRWTLPNGLTLLYRQSSAIPLAAATLLLRTGSYYETLDQAGLANLTTEVLFQGTRRRSARRLADEIESVGASLGGQTSDDFTELGFVAPIAQLDRILDILVDVLTEPTFSVSEMKKERSNVLAGLKSRHDIIFNFAYDAFNAALFSAAHPYGRPIDGQKETVERFSCDDLRNWHREHFHPDRAIFSMIASLPFHQAKTKIDRHFRSWRKTKDFRAEGAGPCIAPLKDQRVRLASRFEQAYLMTGVPAPGVLEADYLPLKVFNTLMGGGMSSRLFLRLREELGLAYEVSSFYPTHWLSSEWVVHLGVPPDKLSIAQKELEKILSKVKHKAPTSEEVKQAVAMIKGSFIMEHQTRRRQAWYTAWWEFLGQGHDYDRHFLEAVDRITPAQVGAVARRLLSKPRLTVEVVPNTKTQNLNR